MAVIALVRRRQHLHVDAGSLIDRVAHRIDRTVTFRFHYFNGIMVFKGQFTSGIGFAALAAYINRLTADKIKGLFC